MSRNMRRSVSILVPAFLLAQLFFVRWHAGAERLAVPPDFSRFPIEFDGWRRLSDEATTPEVVRQLGADRILNANYASLATGKSANVFVAWFQSQRGGASQPHSPQVCLPGAGWTLENRREVTLATAAGTIAVNQFAASRRNDRAVILYWYQSGSRATAGEWASKFWTIASALRYRRTDTSLVRVVVWANGGTYDPAVAAAREFAADLYPLLCARSR
jgi:EpsI family protein